MKLLATICGHFTEQDTNMANQITKLKNINVVKFRGLKNINIEFGSRLTVICGKMAHLNPQFLALSPKYLALQRTLPKP